MIKNIQATTVLPRTRIYKSGYMEALSYETVGLYPKWRTRNISGYISDSIVGDFDNDGKDELLYSAVPKTSMFSNKKKSFLVSQEFF